MLVFCNVGFVVENSIFKVLLFNLFIRDKVKFIKIYLCDVGFLLGFGVLICMVLGLGVEVGVLVLIVVCRSFFMIVIKKFFIVCGFEMDVIVVMVICKFLCFFVGVVMKRLNNRGKKL